MNKNYYYLLITILLIACQRSPIKDLDGNNPDPVVKIEMYLSAFGVESDNFPSIEGKIDFVHKKSNFEKTYYDPANKASTYELSDNEMNHIFDLIKKADLSKLKKEYSTNKSDQPRSTMTIYTKDNEYEIDDYGLEGDSLLIEIYDIAYKID